MEVSINGDPVLLPDFLIVGAAKSGTTSVYEYLRQDESIFMPDLKEPAFFIAVDDESLRDEFPRIITCWDDYINLFRRAQHAQRIGEASPAYLYYYNKAIQNIKKHYSNWEEPKIIIILRHPVDKIISQYKYARMLGKEPEDTLEKALSLEEQRIEQASVHPLLFYKDSSRYYEQVKAYIDNFKYVKVMLYDDLKERPNSFIKEIFNFLDIQIKEGSIDVTQVYNKSEIVLPKSNESEKKYNFLLSFRKSKYAYKFKRYKPIKFLYVRYKTILKTFFYFTKDSHISKEIVTRLHKEFYNEILKLEELTKLDLNHWKRNTSDEKK